MGVHGDSLENPPIQTTDASSLPEHSTYKNNVCGNNCSVFFLNKNTYSNLYYHFIIIQNNKLLIFSIYFLFENKY